MKENVKIAAISAGASLFVAALTAFATIKVADINLRPEYMQRLDALTKEVDNLRAYQVERVDQSSAFFEHMPFPAWLKLVEDGGKTYRMAKINRSYEDTYNVTKLEYEGKTDAEIWGEEIAELYAENDRRVYTTKRAVITHEKVREDPRNQANQVILHIVAKFPVIISGKPKLAIGGISIPIDLVKAAL
jgi:PAS domain-containing protein